MDLSYFRLHSLAFKARYDPAFLLFDRTGEFWHELRSEHPTLKMAQVHPNRLVAVIDRQTQITLELERVVVEHYSLSAARLEGCVALCDTILSRAISTLELSIFNRLGVRLIYRLACRNKQESSDALLGLGLLKVPDGKHFGIAGKATGPHYAIRWEGDTLGVQVNLRTQERKMQVEPPIGDPIFEKIDQELFDSDFDIDY